MIGSPKRFSGNEDCSFCSMGVGSLEDPVGGGPSEINSILRVGSLAAESIFGADNNTIKKVLIKARRHWLLLQRKVMTG